MLFLFVCVRSLGKKTLGQGCVKLAFSMGKIYGTSVHKRCKHRESSSGGHGTSHNLMTACPSLKIFIFALWHLWTPDYNQELVEQF